MIKMETSLTDKAQTFLAEPSNFFNGIKEQSLWKVIGVYFVAGIISLIAGYFVNLISYLLMPKMFGSPLSLIYGMFGIIFFIIGLGLFFVLGLIVHFFVKVIFRGAGSYKETMKVLFYSSVPMIILGFSVLGIFFVVHTLILATIGLSIAHSISKKKAFFSAFIAFLIAIVFIVILILIPDVSFSSMIPL